jgi:hypothetical protein
MHLTIPADGGPPSPSDPAASYPVRLTVPVDGGLLSAF